MLRILTTAAGLLVLPPLATAALRQSTMPGPFAGDEAVRTTRELPLVLRDAWTDRSLRFDQEPGGFEALRREQAVRFTAVPVPTEAGIELLDLDLVRVRVVAREASWQVNGETVGGTRELDATHTLWTGSVAGKPDSDVFLAFTTTGSWGWIDLGPKGRVHVFSSPEDGGRWREAFSVLVHESDPMLGAPPQAYECRVLTPERETTSSKVRPSRPGAENMTGATSYECKIALETDYQYYQKFNDVEAATNYAIALFGAISCRYIDAANTFITLPYLGIYDTVLDPWTSPDVGGSSSTVLQEFRQAWGGQPFPGNAHLANFLSGANLGGGVAYLDVLCNNNFGFAVSGNLHGDTPFPVPQKHVLNWDFVVAAHEAGHNFGTPHTHDYCPPIDECASASAWGPCQDERRCIASGTIMSYCHTCTGGMLNIKTEFHATVANRLSAEAQAACLPSYAPASWVSRNGQGINPQGYTALTDPILGEDWLVDVDIVTPGANTSFVGIGYRGPAGVVVANGEALILPPTLKPIHQGTGGFHEIPIPKDPALLGRTFWTQAATFKPGDVRFQNAIDVFLGL